MGSIDKFLKLYSYKFNKGYPDMNDEQDILLLESILKKEFNIILKEGKQSETENLHEIVFAIGISSLIDNISLPEFKNIKQFLSFIPKLQSLENSNETVKVLKSTLTNSDGSPNLRYADKDGNFQKEFYKYYKDGIESAKNAYQALMKTYKPISTERVNFRGKYGVADDIITVETEDGKQEDILISLKQGPAQFGSLSLSKLFRQLYGIDLEKGLLRTLSKNSKYKNSIDDTVKSYVKVVNDFVKNHPETRELNKPYAKKGWKEWDQMDSPLDENTVTYEELISNVNTRDAYRHIYEIISKDFASDKLNAPYIKAKRENLNPSIDDFLSKLEEGDKLSKDLQERIAELIGFILRSEEDKSYLYVAQQGNKVVSIPSKSFIKSRIKDLGISILPRDEEQQSLTDYSRDLILVDTKNGNRLATIPILFRFDGGQFNIDYVQKGKAPSFDGGFEEFFGAAGDNIKPS